MLVFSQIALKVIRYLGYFSTKFCGLDLLEISQSIHTDSFLLTCLGVLEGKSLKFEDPREGRKKCSLRME